MPRGELVIVLDINLNMLKLKAYFCLAPQRILDAFWSLAGFWQFRFRFADKRLMPNPDVPPGYPVAAVRINEAKRT